MGRSQTKYSAKPPSTSATRLLRIDAAFMMAIMPTLRIRVKLGSKAVDDDSGAYDA